MKERINQGYTITDSVHVRDYEYVIAHHPTAPSPYVVWRVSNGDYYWGHYFSDRWDALQDLSERISEAVQYHREEAENA